MKAVHHSWIARDVVGGNRALDLVNTVSGWSSSPEDWVPDIGTFLAWAGVSCILDAREKANAQRQAERSPVAADRVLASVKELRFALWGIVDCLQDRRPPKLDDLCVLNQWMRRLALSEQMVFARGEISLAISRDISVLELPAFRVTKAALGLLKDPSLKRIKTCVARDCGWKFVDQSKNHSRRWCDMGVCGNLAKARRYRARNN